MLADGAMVVAGVLADEAAEALLFNHGVALVSAGVMLLAGATGLAEMAVCCETGRPVRELMMMVRPPEL